MTDKTSTQNLTRTTATDDPKKMASYLKTLATETDQRMHSQRYHLGRSQRPPFAFLRRSAAMLYDKDAYPSNVPFDIVGEDTAGMVDLSVDPSGIYFRSTGWYQLGAYVLLSGFGSPNADVTIYIGNEGEAAARDQGSGAVGVSVSTLQQVSSLAADPAIRLVISSLGSSTTSVTTLYYAQMYAYKVRDL